MGRLICGLVATVFVAVSFPGSANAKFLCEVESIEGTTLVLKNCQEKGLKRLSPGDKVDIIKKRKKKAAAVEGC